MDSNERKVGRSERTFHTFYVAKLAILFAAGTNKDHPLTSITCLSWCCALDAANREVEAETHYERALSLGLREPQRHLARIQLASTLRVLGRPAESLSVLDAVATITRLVRQAAGSTCTVLAGSGLTVDAVGDFVRATGVRAVHFGSGVRPRGEVLAPVDQSLVERVRAAIDGAAAHV